MLLLLFIIVLQAIQNVGFYYLGFQAGKEEAQTLDELVKEACKKGDE